MPSLPSPTEIEPHEQHVRLPLVRQRAEGLELTGLLDGPLGFQVERKIARAADEAEVGDRSIAVHEERYLRLEGRALGRPLPPPEDLRHDVRQVLRERELDSFRADRRHVVAGGRPLPWKRRRLGRGARRRLAAGRVGGGRRRGPGHRSLGRPLRRRRRRRWLLGRPFDGLGRLARLLVGLRGGDQPDLVGRRHAQRRPRRGEQKRARRPVHHDGPDQPEPHARGRLGTPALHRSMVSGSVTRPTSATPAARITARTRMTVAYAARPSARRYTPLGRLLRTKAGKVAWKSWNESAAWSRKMRPSRSTVTTSPDFGSSGRALARGSRTSTPPCMIGAVIMKMMSNTKATSTRDVTLISAFRGSSPCPRNPPPPR